MRRWPPQSARHQLDGQILASGARSRRKESSSALRSSCWPVWPHVDVAALAAPRASESSVVALLDVARKTGPNCICAFVTHTTTHHSAAIVSLRSRSRRSDRFTPSPIGAGYAAPTRWSVVTASRSRWRSLSSDMGRTLQAISFDDARAARLAATKARACAIRAGSVEPSVCSRSLSSK